MPAFGRSEPVNSRSEMERQAFRNQAAYRPTGDIGSSFAAMQQLCALPTHKRHFDAMMSYCAKEFFEKDNNGLRRDGLSGTTHSP